MNTKIKLEDSVQDVLIKMSDGNPGALTVCLQILEKGKQIDPDNAFGGIGAILSLDTLGLYGPDIWMLYADVCHNDLPKMLAVLRGVQLGLVSNTQLRSAVENYGAGLDIPTICAQVTQKLPRFRLNLTSLTYNMTLTNITTLLLPLTNAIAFQSWEDAEDLAKEISRMCRLKRLEELQAVQELRKDLLTPPGVSQEANPYIPGYDWTPISQADEQTQIKASDVSVVKAAIPVTLETRFDETGHEDKWRDKAARELNFLLVTAHRSGDGFFQTVAVSLAARVAQFEEIAALK